MSVSGAPTIRITAAPTNPTTTTKASFSFSTSGKSVSTTCQLDGKTTVNCSSPKTYTGLSYGSHTFLVRANNRSGSSNASMTWREVRPAPTVTLASPSPSSTTGTSASLAWTSTDATSIVCQLDGNSPATCASPVTYTGLAVGTHSFKVTVSNTSGSASASATWAVIAAAQPVPAAPAPTVTLTSAPASTGTNASASLSWTSTDATSIVCQLDGSSPATCASPATYSGLAVGSHTFTVTASNASGSARASATWTVAAAPVPKPTVTLASPPTGSTTSTSAALAWTSTDATSIVCQLDSGSPAACASPVTYSGLAVGTHTFTVTVSNTSGSASASATWTVAAAPVAKPTVTLASPPTGSTTSTSATLSWTSTNATSIACQLDGGSPAACASPVTYSGLAVGTHSFAVTVSNTSGSASASASWTVTSPPDPPSSPSGIQPPAPPASYSIPASAVTVTTSAALKTALAGSTRDIVLADGTYDNSSQFVNSSGHRLYAQHLGGAVLTAGIEMGGNGSASGGLIQGLVFNVSSPAKTLDDGIVHIWGSSGAGSEVLDCVFHGNNVIQFGLLARNPDGLVAQRLQFYDFTGVALWASDDTTVAYGAKTPIINSISDIYVDGVSASPPGSSDGTAEAGLWIGHPVTNGVHRIETHNVSWSGIETVSNSWNTTFSDINIDMSGPNESAGVGIYLEHFNYNNTFENFSIRGANTGINAEWDDPSWGGVAAAHNTVIENGTIDAAGANSKQTIGIWLDEGTDSTTITGVKFLNQNWAAICEYEITGTNNVSGNDYSGLGAGVPAISTGHP